jgi:hypothetical protein
LINGILTPLHRLVPGQIGIMITLSALGGMFVQGPEISQLRYDGKETAKATQVASHATGWFLKK